MFDLKDGDDYYGWARQHPVPTADRLRLLLARRMVREGMIDQALPYFPAEADPRFARMRYDAAGVAKLENDASRARPPPMRRPCAKPAMAGAAPDGRRPGTRPG